MFCFAKTIIVAPSDGVVLIRNLEVGETVAPAGVVMVIGQLEEVEQATVCAGYPLWGSSLSR